MDFKIITVLLQKGVFAFSLTSMGYVIFIVPAEEFFLYSSITDKLTLMGILEQNEGLVSGKINGVSSVSVITTAEKDSCVPVITALWQRTDHLVPVTPIFVIPLNASFFETLWAQYRTLIKYNWKGF